MLFNKNKTDVETELSLYEKRRKLEIDEALSEYRRSEKNKAVQEVKNYSDALTNNSRELFIAEHEAEKQHYMAVADYSAELASLDDLKDAKAAEIEQVEKDFEARGLLRDRAIKAEKEKENAVMAEKDKHIAFLEASNKTLSEQNTGLLSKVVEALGKAADKEAITKVVGFGPSSEPKKF